MAITSEYLNTILFNDTSDSTNDSNQQSDGMFSPKDEKKKEQEINKSSKEANDAIDQIGSEMSIVSSGYESFVNLVKPKLGGIDAKMSYMGNAPETKAHPGTRLHVRTIDNKLFRLYLCANTIIDCPYFQNRFCIFLDSLTPDQTVFIELGAGLNGSEPDPQIGMMISAIRNCQAHTVTIASGRCGFAESCLFVYGKDKVISPYGALLYTGLTSYKDMMPMYVPFFTQIFKDAVQAQVLGENEFNILTTTGKFVMRTEKEIIIP